MAPFIRNTLTDVFGQMQTSANTECGPFEIRALECIEYFGAQRGRKLCQDYFDDTEECRMKTIQVGRPWGIEEVEPGLILVP